MLGNNIFKSVATTRKKEQRLPVSKKRTRCLSDVESKENVVTTKPSRPIRKCRKQISIEDNSSKTLKRKHSDLNFHQEVTCNETKKRHIESKTEASNVDTFLQRLITNASKRGIPTSLRQAFYKADLNQIYAFAIEYIKQHQRLLENLKPGDAIRFDKSDYHLPRTIQITVSEKGKLHLFVETNRKSKTGEKDLADAFIGAGTYKTVLRCYRLDSKSAKAWACAKIKEDIDDAIKEASLANRLVHPHIFHCEVGQKYKNGNKIALYSKLAIGTLDDVINGKIYASEQDKNTLIMQIFDAVDFMHANQVIHQDIKPENVLIFKDKDGQLVAKLNDFGLSVSSDEPTSRNPKSTFGYESPQILAFYKDKGSELHDYYFNDKSSTLAKEIYRAKGHVGIKPDYVNAANDCWALGIMYYELLNGKKPTLKIINSNRQTGNAIVDGLLAVHSQDRFTCNQALGMMHGKMKRNQLRTI